MVEEGSKVIVASSESTAGYYRFDLNNLQAEKLSSSADVFNASDLANGVLAFDKKKKKDKPEEETKTTAPAAEAIAAKADAKEDLITKSGIAVFPNPVTNGSVNLSFADQPAGRYQVQLLDLSGKTYQRQRNKYQQRCADRKIQHAGTFCKRQLPAPGYQRSEQSECDQ